MSFLFRLVFLLIFATTFSAAAAAASPLEERQTSSSPYPIGAPGIVIKVTSPNGTDLTSGFQTLFYYDKDVPSNLTDRSLEERQIPGSSIRYIDTCMRRGAEFQSSFCHYLPNHPNSLQHYLVKCEIRRMSNGRLIYQTITEQGSCNHDEICINGPRDRPMLPAVARCIGQRSFKPIPPFDEPEVRARVREFFTDGMTSTLVVSEIDKSTPMNVQSLELDAGIAGVGRGGGQVGVTSEKKCEDCLELSTGPLPIGTDSLMTEATVAGAAGVGAAGVLWLAALSG